MGMAQQKTDPSEKFINEFRARLERLGMRVIEGDASFYIGAFVIGLASIEDLEREAEDSPEGSLCVMSIKRYDGTENLALKNPDDEAGIDPETGDVTGLAYQVNVYVRLGTTNTWLTAAQKTPLGERLVSVDDLSDEDDADYEYEEYKPDPDAPLKGLHVAEAQGFNLLRNQQQRETFTADIAKREGWENQSDLFIRDAASYAASYYEAAVLPMRIRRLQEDGRAISEIAKELGHTKNKIEKNLNFVAHAFSRDLMIKNGFKAAREDMQAHLRDGFIKSGMTPEQAEQAALDAINSEEDD
jgi:hypothetical protein